MANLIVIAGPSGSGKGTLIEAVIGRLSGLVLSTSATTRDKRPGEIDGREYFFLDAVTFQRWIEEDKFLEWAEYSGNLYGTPKSAVEHNLSGGRDVLLEIELRGAWQVLAQMPDALMIFIEPPSLEELERRLRGRNTESDESIRARLARAREEMAEVQAEMGPGGRHRFDYVIVNDSVQRASDELARVIQESRDGDEQAYDR